MGISTFPQPLAKSSPKITIKRAFFSVITKFRSEFGRQYHTWLLRAVVYFPGHLRDPRWRRAASQYEQIREVRLSLCLPSSD